MLFFPHVPSYCLKSVALNDVRWSLAQRYDTCGKAIKWAWAHEGDFICVVITLLSVKNTSVGFVVTGKLL